LGYQCATLAGRPGALARAGGDHGVAKFVARGKGQSCRRSAPTCACCSSVPAPVVLMVMTLVAVVFAPMARLWGPRGFRARSAAWRADGAGAAAGIAARGL
jgi:hypothetical protein